MLVAIQPWRTSGQELFSGLLWDLAALVPEAPTPQAPIPAILPVDFFLPFLLLPSLAQISFSNWAAFFAFCQPVSFGVVSYGRTSTSEGKSTNNKAMRSINVSN